MLSKNIFLKNYNTKNSPSNVKKIFKKEILKEIKNNKNILTTLSKNYKYNFKKKILFKYKKFKEINIIGMGGSILGSEAIYCFLNHKIKKKINFFDNIENFIKNKKKNLLMLSFLSLETL